MSGIGFRGKVQLRIGNNARELPVVSFDHIESIYDGARWVMRLEHPQWHFLAPLVEGESPDLPLFDYKFGIEGSGIQGGFSAQESPWFRGTIVRAESDNTVHGSRVKILGGDAAVRMKGRTRTQFWSTNFDQMVSAIAADYGLKTVVQKADETTKERPITYWQYGENDWTFIRRIAAKVRSILDYRGDYEMWIQNGDTLHVRPPGVSGAPATKKWGIGELGVGLKGVRLVQRKRALMMEGGFSVQGIAFDTLTKTPVTFVKNYNNFPENTRLGPKVNPPSLSEIPARTFRSTDEDLPSLQNTATTVLGNSFRHMYLAEASIFPDFKGYAVGDVVTLAISQDNGSRPDQVYSGNYLLEQRRTRIVREKIEMRLLLSRVGSATGSVPVSGRQMDVPAIEKPEGRLRRVTGL